MAASMCGIANIEEHPHIPSAAPGSIDFDRSNYGR
jgi:hypothetical protein